VRLLASNSTVPVRKQGSLLRKYCQSLPFGMLLQTSDIRFADWRRTGNIIHYICCGVDFFIDQRGILLSDFGDIGDQPRFKHGTFGLDASHVPLESVVLVNPFSEKQHASLVSSDYGGSTSVLNEWIVAGR
jgi:hypothetical protein